MTNESAPTRCNQPAAVQLRRDIYAFVPWLHLFRAVPIAVRPRMLLLGAVGWGAILLGLFALQAITGGQTGASPHVLWGNTSIKVPIPGTAVPLDRQLRRVDHLPSVLTKLSLPLDGSVVEHLPLNTFYGSLIALINRQHTWVELAYEWTVLLWTLLVWGLVGGAICRLAALQFARHESRGIRYALRFSSRQGLSYLIGPLLPLTGIGCLAAVNAVLGLIVAFLNSLTGVGWWSILLTVSVAVSYVMLLLLMGLGIGWPLMIAAISTEDSDGFDGLSRSFSFLWDRPWHAAGLTACGTVLFLLGRMALVVGVEALVMLESWSVRLALPESLRLDLSVSPITTACMSIIAAFGPSFFFSAVTIIYFLLRQSDDGTPLTEVVSLRDEPLYPRAEVVETPAEVAATTDAAATQATATPSPAVPPKDA